MTFSKVKFVAISLYVKLSSVEFSDGNSLTAVLLFLSHNLKRFISVSKLVSLLSIFSKKRYFLMKSKVTFEFLVYPELQNENTFGETSDRYPENDASKSINYF